MSRFHRSVLACLLLVAGLSGCAALQSFAALTQVQFDLDRVTGIRLAGVQLDRVRSYTDLTITDVTRVGTALARGSLPLDLNLHISAENPEDNPDARLLGMEWTLFLHDRETLSGILDREILMRAGERTDIAFLVELDLLEFFDGTARELVEIAASLAGEEGNPVELRLEILPSVDTPLGPIRYPRPLVLGGTVGGAGAEHAGPGRVW